MEDQIKNEKIKENELLVLSTRRLNNARMQLKSVVLEVYEIFGGTFTQEVLDECAKIYEDFKKLDTNV